MAAASPIDLSPLVQLALLGLALALGPLAWVAWRHRSAAAAAKLRALTLLTLFLTFDLVLFGAFTRLTDSGLGCPDWPGCYGSASPIGARPQIEAAQTVLPSGPVTHGKAWVEMLHRYLASAVGVLIIVTAVAGWWLQGRRRRTDDALPSPWWATVTLAWVCLQGAFGAFTVTMKLYPAIVTAHLLGGLVLLGLLAAQAQMFQPRPLPTTRSLRAGLWALAGLTALQVALGGWVSTNYAVLACTEFPTCQGSWWPAMDFVHAFALRRELGTTAAGDFLPFAALTAIHYTHRLMAVVVLLAIAGLAWRMQARGAPPLRRWGLALAACGGWQLLTGLSNVVLGWPLLAAVAHTGGAATLVLLLTVLLVRVHQAQRLRQQADVPAALRLA